MPRRKPPAYINEDPSGDDDVARIDQDQALIEFSRRLQNAMLDKGWTQSELARQAERHFKGRFGRDNVSNYIRGKSMPGPLRLHALARALGTTPVSLVPARAMQTSSSSAPPVSVKDLGGGDVWLSINQRVPWDRAIKILDVLKKENHGGEAKT